MKKTIKFKLENGEEWLPCEITIKTLMASVGNDLARKHQKEIRDGNLAGYFEDKLWSSVESIEGIEIKSLTKLKEKFPQYVFDKILDEVRLLEEVSQKESFRVEESNE